jgi:hypothetical protein
MRRRQTQARGGAHPTAACPATDFRRDLRSLCPLVGVHDRPAFPSLTHIHTNARTHTPIHTRTHTMYTSHVPRVPPPVHTPDRQTLQPLAWVAVQVFLRRGHDGVWQVSAGSRHQQQHPVVQGPGNHGGVWPAGHGGGGPDGVVAQCVRAIRHPHPSFARCCVGTRCVSGPSAVSNATAPAGACECPVRAEAGRPNSACIRNGSAVSEVTAGWVTTGREDAGCGG